MMAKSSHSMTHDQASDCFRQFSALGTSTGGEEGMLDYRVFCLGIASTMGSMILDHDLYKFAFDIFDLDGNGTMEHSEYVYSVKALLLGNTAHVRRAPLHCDVRAPTAGALPP